MKKGKWRVLGFILAMMMLFTACAQQEPQSSDLEEENSVETEGEGSEVEEEAFDEDPTVVDVMFWTLTTIPDEENITRVEEAINEITRKKINVEINLNILESGNYTEQVNLMVAGGEKIDLMVTLPGGSAHFNSMVSQNQLTDITDLLAEYAPELLQELPERWLEGTTVDRQVYAVPSMGNKVTPLYFVCRKDIVEKTGIDSSTISDANGLEELFAKALEVEPDIVPVAISKTGFASGYLIDEEGAFQKYDGIGDGNNQIVCVMEENGATVYNTYERPEFLETAQRFKEWYENGYIYTDAATYTDAARSLVASNVAFGYFGMIPAGGEATESEYCTHEMEFICLDTEPLLTTSKLRQFTWAVPSTSKEPEAAVKLLNLLYTDPDVLNLITWGIEDVHYQTLEDGTIDFLDGEDVNTCGYYIGDITNILGNGYLAKVRNGQQVDLREQAKAANNKATLSEYLGFDFDTTGMENEVSAITVTIEEYRPSLITGLYTDRMYTEFIEKLKDSGSETFISGIQDQLDEYLIR